MAKNCLYGLKGNVYFNGAKAYKNETNNLVDTEHSVTVDLNMEDGCPVLSTNLYEFLGDFGDSMVNSDILGYAFEPEERFENPDGTDIVFDRRLFRKPQRYPCPSRTFRQCRRRREKTFFLIRGYKTGSRRKIPGRD